MSDTIHDQLLAGLKLGDSFDKVAQIETIIMRAMEVSGPERTP
jgi:hypothetical protein